MSFEKRAASIKGNAARDQLIADMAKAIDALQAAVERLVAAASRPTLRR